MTDILFDEDIDWDKRILCSDESCIGVIGPDGTSDREIVAQEPDGGMSDENQSDDDWDSRVLCSDGACIGVIGPDGKCKECGKPLKD